METKSSMLYLWYIGLVVAVLTYVSFVISLSTVLLVIALILMCYLQ
jgi:hypothetical protein